MPIQVTSDNLIHDHSAGATDSDIAYNDGTLSDLESRSTNFYDALETKGLISGVDPATTYGDAVLVGASVDDWVTITGESRVNELVFAADGSGTALDGDVWTITDSDGTTNVTTVGGLHIYLYAVDGGSVLVGSTTAPSSSFAPTSLTDFTDNTTIVLVGFLDATTDNKSAEVYLASFQAIANPDPTKSDGDPVDLADNVWLYGDTRQTLTFSGLDPKKFLFGIAGEDDPDGKAISKLFVLAEDYNVKSDTAENFEKGNTSGALLNTSNAGKFLLRPDIDIATLGVNNQSVNPDQGVFIMLVTTDQEVGNYYRGADANGLDTIQTQSTMGFGIVQAVGDTASIQIEVSGYLGAFSDGEDLIKDTGATKGAPDQTLGKADDAVGLVSITVESPLGTDTVLVADGLTQTLTINGRSIEVVFSGNDGDSNPTLATLTGVASQDLVTATWVADIDHALLHTNNGAIDWGIVDGQLGGDISANIGAQMFVDDDGPTASVSAGSEPGPEYLFDGNTTPLGNFEGNNGTNLPTDDKGADEDPKSVTVDYSGAFNMTGHDYGKDGGTALASTYSIRLDATLGGPVMMGGDAATSGGVALVWAAVSGGYAAQANGTTVFSITVDSMGKVTFTLAGVVDHDGTNTDPVTIDILSLDNGQLALVRSDKITDLDGDTSTDPAEFDLGGNFGVGDDAPVASVSGDGDLPTAKVLYDGNLGDAATAADDGNFEGDGSGGDTAATGVPDSVTLNFSGAFSDTNLFGADGAASANSETSAYSFVPATGLVGSDVMMDDGAVGTSAQVKSGGVGLIWALDNGDYVAETSDDNTVIFRLSIDSGSGVVTVTRSGVLDHLDEESAAPYTDDVLYLSDGQLEVQRKDTVTDSDGDSDMASAKVDMGGTIGFGDDASVVDVVAEDTDDEIEALGVNLDETIDLISEPVPDGFDHFAEGEEESPSDLDPGTYASGLGNGDADDVIVGGTPNTPVWDDDPLSGASGEAIGLLESTAGQIAALFGDGDDDLSDGGDDIVKYGADGAGSTDASLAFKLSGGASGYKTSLIATPVVDSDLDGVLETSREIYLFEKADGDGDITIIEGRVMGPDNAWGTPGEEFPDDYVILRMTLTNKDDPDNATIIYENFAPVQNSDPLLQDEADSLFITDGGNLSIVYTATAKDFDKDEATDTASVQIINATRTVLEIDDDGPGAVGSGDTVELWEDALTNGRSDNDPKEVEITSDTGSVADQVDGGTDGVKSFGWTSAPLFITMLNGKGYSSGGTNLVWSVAKDVDGGTNDVLTATKGSGGPAIIEVTMTETGTYTVAISGPLDHPQEVDGIPVLGQPDEDILSIDLTDGLEAFEGDDDPVNFGSAALVLDIEDDAPKADVNADGTEPAAVYLFDGKAVSGGYVVGDNGTAVSSGDAAVSGSNSVTVGFSGAFTTNHLYGADGPESTTPSVVTYTLELGDSDDATPVRIGDDVMMNGGQVTSGGASNVLVWAAVDGGYAAVIDGPDPKTEVFRLTVNGTTGEVTFLQSAVLDHTSDGTAPFSTDAFILDDDQVFIRRSDTIKDADLDPSTDSAKVDLGGNFAIGDDGPEITPSGGSLTKIGPLAFVKVNLPETETGEITYGADGAGTYKITSVSAVNTATNTELGTISSMVDGSGLFVTYFSSVLDAADGTEGNGAFLKVSVDPTDGDYSALVMANAPLIKVPLLDGATTPGGPVEEFTPPTNIVTFDGYIFTDWDANTGGTLKSQFDNGGDNNEPVNSGASNEDINIDTNGIGLENAIMNEGEGLLLDFTDSAKPVGGVSIEFDGPTGGLSTFAIRLEAWDGDTLIDSITLDPTDPEEYLVAPKGKNVLVYDYLAPATFTHLYLSTDLTGNDAIRIPEIFAFTFADIDDLAGTVNVQLTDFDGDTDTDSFVWEIDGDGDGGISIP